MKATIDLENLEEIVKSGIEKNVEVIIKEEVDHIVHDQVNKIAKEKVEELVNISFEKFVKDYIKTAVIKTGGSFWDDEEPREYTVEQFIKQQLKERLESNTLKVKKIGKISSYSDDFEKVTFEEYIKRTCDVNGQIEEVFGKKLNNFMDEIRKDINKTMKDTFDNSTKSLLSNAVLNILSANDTYKQIENNIKCIANKKDE